LFTTLIENLRLCSYAEAGIVLNLFLNFKQNESRVLIKRSVMVFLSDDVITFTHAKQEKTNDATPLHDKAPVYNQVMKYLKQSDKSKL